MTNFSQYEIGGKADANREFAQYELPPEPGGSSGLVQTGAGQTINGDLLSPNYVKGVKGWKVDSEGNAEFQNAVITGGVATSEIDIGGSDNTSFHVDTGGNMWLGDATYAAAPAKISNAGAATFANATITGGTISGSMTIGTGNVNIAARGWTQTCVFSVTDADTVAWASGSFISADGTTYSISAGNTGNMAAATYIYLDTNISTTVYQTTTTAATAVGAGKVLIAKAQNGTTEATFQAFGGIGGTNIDASSIVANSITANELSTSLLYAGSMQLDTAGNIRSGQSDYATGTGFWLGNSGGTPKFSIGDSTYYMKWTGTALDIKSTLPDVQSFTASGTWTKPSVGTVAFVQIWGAGGSGATGATASGKTGGGGGGGAYVERRFLLSDLGATETVTIGAGGASQTVADSNGTAGGATSFGASSTLVTAYGGGAGETSTIGGGGGGGGGVFGAGQDGGITSAGYGGNGGRPLGGTGGTSAAPTGEDNSGGGGGGGGAGFAAVGGGDSGGWSYTGGGGGGGGTDGNFAPRNGGNSIWGGAGGGGGAGGTEAGGSVNELLNNGGVSTNGGNGGSGATGSTNATAGTSPGGGGGGTEDGDSGAGANGKVIVTVF